MAIEVPKMKLNSGYEMPTLALGTGWPSLPDPDQLTSIFLYAIEIGYRHFDTSPAYGTEEAIGGAIAAALQRRLIASRDELFITTKLWMTQMNSDLVIPALKRSLGRLGVDYVDLYLVHWPFGMKNDTGEECMKFVTENIIPFDMKRTWEGMEECYNLGLAKSIGVSNFSAKKISKLLHHATILPAVNQVEMNVTWQQGKLLEFCKEKEIHVSAWSPLGGNGAWWGQPEFLEIPILKDIAYAKQKTTAQIALRWIFQQGASIAVKSFTKENMNVDIQIFDWELNDEEIYKIKQIPQRKGFRGEIFVHPNGPYKTIEELWDEDA